MLQHQRVVVSLGHVGDLHAEEDSYFDKLLNAGMPDSPPPMKLLDLANDALV